MNPIRDQHIPGVLRLHAPVEPAVPLVFDSPHSGTDYPADFGAMAPVAELRAAEDTFDDDLYGAAPGLGAPLLCALFPRLYIDPNRAETDMDPAEIEGAWDGPPLSPGAKSRLGQGVVWTRRPPGLPVYDGKLPAAALRARIEGYHRPYHRALARVLDATAARFGGYYHVNCHSMPSLASNMSAEPPGTKRPDIVLGTLDGLTAGPELVDAVRAHLSGRGLDVRVNEWFKGLHIIRAAGDPARGRHSLQIEVNRRLYMDEERIGKGPGYATIRSVFTDLIENLRRFAAARPPGPK